MRRHGLALVSLTALTMAAGMAHADETYSFDESEFKKKAFEVSGYVEAKGEVFGFNKRSSFYGLGHPNGKQPSESERGTGTAEISAKYSQGIATFGTTFHTDGQRDVVKGNHQEAKVYEANLTLQPDTGLSLDVGKKVLKWGKGYAWNPVGFVERPKDPTDPDLSRQGYWMVAGDITRSFDGPVQTVGLTTVFLPTSTAINNDFGTRGHQDVAAKLSLLVADTDIDLMALNSGAKSQRYGADFARNLNPRMEVHGEYAWITKSQRMLLDATQKPYPEIGVAPTWLLGARYLTDQATTYIVEFYHNGSGFRPNEQKAFFSLADQGVDQFRSTGSRTLLNKASAVSSGYSSQSPGRDYVNFKVSQDEPFGIVYLTPSLTVIADLADKSAQILPELLYTGFSNWELRLRLQANLGAKLTEYGEKEAATRGELRVRYYF